MSLPPSLQSHLYAVSCTSLGSFRFGRCQLGNSKGVNYSQRDTDLPEVPTIAESGIRDFEVVSWQGLCTNAAAPQAALARLRTALAATLEQPDTRKRLVDQGFQLYVMPAEQFAAFIGTERARWAKVVKAIGLEPQ